MKQLDLPAAESTHDNGSIGQAQALMLPGDLKAASLPPHSPILAHYVLLNAIHSFRNRSQHADGQEIPLGVAVAAIMLCIELLGCLACECPRSAWR